MMVLVEAREMMSIDLSGLIKLELPGLALAIRGRPADKKNYSSPRSGTAL
jgi:hypothetical protein